MRDTHRKLERWFTGRMGRAERAEYELELQQQGESRRQYDQLFDFLRALDESSDSSPIELELVEARLFSESPSPREAPSALDGSSSWLWAGVAALVAAGLLVVLVPRLSDPGASTESGGGIAYAPPNPTLGVGQGFVARGGKPGEGLAVEFFCASPARPILDASCPIDEELSFAFKVEDWHGERDGGAHLSLFGINAAGDTMYYFPTPADPSLPVAEGADWTAIEHSVRLDVNHRPGRLRVFALWSPVPPTTDDVDQIVSQLEDTALAEDESWTRALPASLQNHLCGPSDRCRSARAELTISPESKP